jgi:putative effector of murein hydrolase
MIVAGLLARELRFSPNLIASLSIKSATTPIAVEIAKVVQVTPALTAIFVVATGVIGAALGPWLMDRIGITHPVARGLALGTISHGIGAAQAASESELAGAAAGVGMGLGAVSTAWPRRTLYRCWPDNQAGGRGKNVLSLPRETGKFLTQVSWVTDGGAYLVRY